MQLIFGSKKANKSAVQDLDTFLLKKSIYIMGPARFCHIRISSSALPLSAKDGERLDEEKARLDNVEKGENNTAATATSATAANATSAAATEKTPEKKAETVKDKPSKAEAEADKKSEKSNKSNGAHTPV